MRPPLLKNIFAGLVLGSLCLGGALAAQISGDFRTPIVGYVLDRHLQAIRPIVGILGSSRIEEPMDFGFAIREAMFLSDQRHAIVVPAGSAEVLVVDLETTVVSARIAGVSSPVSMIRTSHDGTHAGLFVPALNELLLMDGLPNTPVLRDSLDVSFAGFPLSRFAVSKDGIVLLAFHADEGDVVYSWASGTGPRFVTTASRVTDMVLTDTDAVIADAGANQLLMVKDVRGRALRLLIADNANGVSEPAAVAVSSRREIYAASRNSILVLDEAGQMLRKINCACRVVSMVPLADSAFRLTDELDHPLFVLDSRSVPEQILFVPALSVTTAEPAE